MSAVELDPVFVKALKFLHSKAKDSGAQLKALLDDAIAQRKGLKVSKVCIASKFLIFYSLFIYFFKM